MIILLSRKCKLLAIGLITISLMIFAPLSLSSQDDDDGQLRARELLSQGVILPLRDIIEKAQGIHKGKLLELEFKQKSNQYIYEIELLDKDGIVWEMYFDATNGSLLKIEKED